MLCDDELGFIEWGIEILKKYPDFEIIGNATSGEECIEKIDDGLVPDILLLDISMPNGKSGYEVAKYVQTKQLPIKIIAISMINDLNAIKAMIRFGVMGFVYKGDSFKNLDTIIRRVYNGDEYYPIELSFTSSEIREIKNTPIPWLEQITEREMLAVKLIAVDLLTKQVAENMGISESVVNKKINNVKLKTSAKSNSGIIYFFKKVGLLK
jgi:DNA-binding NarL/FixJ family response regulator